MVVQARGKYVENYSLRGVIERVFDDCVGVRFDNGVYRLCAFDEIAALGQEAGTPVVWVDPD